MTAATETERQCDLLVIGAGMAGSCLARQIKLAHPELSVVVVDAKTEFDAWVGESSIEVFVDYANRHLQLGPYLARHHMIKQSLRYYWDDEDGDLPIWRMSEFGVSGYHAQMSYQIDRARFDPDLCELNRRIGVEVHLGVRVLSGRGRTGITLDRDGGHRVQTTAGTWRCRWLVDAAGRKSPLCRLLGVGGPDPRHLIGGYWGRYRNVTNLDTLGDDAWHRRAGLALRHLATNHFMYRGYWIWTIPVSDDTTSIGVMFDNVSNPLQLRNADDLTAFLREHRCLRDVLGPDAEAVDFHGLRHVARYSERLFSTDRWFLTGMSGLFPDPFLSTGCAFISIANRLIGTMIDTDLSGDEDRFARQAVAFEAHLQGMYETFRRTNDHTLFGSFDVMAPFRHAGQQAYHNVLIPTGMEDLATLVADVDAGRAPTEPTPGCFALARHRVAREYLEHVDAADAYHGMNREHVLEGAVPEVLKKKYHLPRDPQVELEHLRTAWRDLFATYVRRVCERQGIAFDEAAFDGVFDPDWRAGQTLREVTDALAQRHREAS